MSNGTESNSIGLQSNDLPLHYDGKKDNFREKIIIDEKIGTE